MVLDERERSMSKALPGTVVTYDSATKTCTVRPGVHRLVMSADDFDEDEIEELPAIPNVPVMWPQGRGFAFTPTIGLLPGDPVLLICCDRDISGWLTTGVPSEPDDSRSHSWSSAVAIPGLVPATYVNVPADAAALASRVLAELAEIKVAFNALRLAYLSHVHVESGGSTAIPTVPSTYPCPGAVAAAASVASAALKLSE